MTSESFVGKSRLESAAVSGGGAGVWQWRPLPARSVPTGGGPVTQLCRRRLLVTGGAARQHGPASLGADGGAPVPPAARRGRPALLHGALAGRSAPAAGAGRRQLRAQGSVPGRRSRLATRASHRDLTSAERQAR